MTAPPNSISLSSAYDSLLLEAGGTWPAKPSYDFPDGPLKTLHEIALEAPNVFAKTMDVNQISPDDYIPNRKWMEERLPSTASTLEALRELEEQHLVLGISATVTILSHLYRYVYLILLPYLSPFATEQPPPPRGACRSAWADGIEVMMMIGGLTDHFLSFPAFLQTGGAPFRP